MTKIATAEMATLSNGKVLHHLRELEHSRGGTPAKGKARCGATGNVGNQERHVDVRAIRVKGRTVCVTCTQLALRELDAGAGSVHHQIPDERKETRTMTKQVEKWRDERTSTNNKISGVKTQLKRLGTRRGDDAVARRKELNTRLKTLQKERTELNDKIARAEGGEGSNSSHNKTPADDLADSVRARTRGGKGGRAGTRRRAKTTA